jgi:hypothetical protein
MRHRLGGCGRAAHHVPDHAIAITKRHDLSLYVPVEFGRGMLVTPR